VTGQAVHDIRRQLATSVFKVPIERMRVMVPDVGGGFGMKNFLYPEYVLVLWAARKLGRPVRWVSERAEDFVSSAHGRDLFARSKLALDKDGRFLALDVRALANMGAYLSTNGPISSTNAAGSAMGGVYNIPSISVEVRGVFTNTPPVDAYRGAGKPEANYLIERLVNLASIRTGIDCRPVAPPQHHRQVSTPHGDGHDDRRWPLRRQSGRGGRARRFQGLSRASQDNRRPQACCAASGLPAFSKRPEARQPSSPAQRSRPTVRCRWLSARTPTDRAMKPPTRR